MREEGRGKGRGREGGGKEGDICNNLFQVV